MRKITNHFVNNCKTCKTNIQRRHTMEHQTVTKTLSTLFEIVEIDSKYIISPRRTQEISSYPLNSK